MSSLKPCLFLDRDGVIVKNVPYMHKSGDVEIIPETAKLIRIAKDAGWFVVVVTNQSGVARGYFTAGDCEKLNSFIDQKILESSGGKIDRWEYCPDLVASDYRKPAPGMLLNASQQLPIDISRSLMLGDNVSDIIDLPGLTCHLVQSDRDISKAPAHITKFNTYVEMQTELAKPYYGE